MRKLTNHIVEGDSANHQLCIQVMDEPGSGGACHEYDISGYCTNDLETRTPIHFQNGPISEFGVNGITQEALLAIVIDRLEGFQDGPFACTSNAMALDHCHSALEHLQSRTRERIARGVEGKLVE